MSVTFFDKKGNKLTWQQVNDLLRHHFGNDESPWCKNWPRTIVPWLAKDYAWHQMPAYDGLTSFFERSFYVHVQSQNTVINHMG